MAPNHGGEPLGSILGPMGSHSGQKMGKNRKKITMPQNEFLTTPRSSIWAKNRIYGYSAKSRWAHLGSNLGPMGFHWGQKMGQNRQKLPCPKSRIFDYSAVIDFGQKIEFTVMAQNHGGEPLGSILGPMGSHWGKKLGQNRKKLPCPTKFEFFTTPRSSIWAKNRIYGYGSKSRWGHPRVHLGANGVPLGPKNGSKPSKITMPQNSNFWLLRGHRFGKKIEFTAITPNHGGGP